MKKVSFVDVAGSPLTYQEQGEGPTIILIPGLDGTALLFYRQVPLLAKRFHVLTFPLPNDSRCTMASLVENLRQAISEVTKLRGEERVMLCGESFGGALSLSFALSHPEMLSGLIVLNSFPVIRKRMQLRIAPPVLKAMPWGAMRLVRRFTESRMHTSHTLPEDLDEFHQRMRWVGREGYIRRLEILQSYNIQDQLAQIRTPTLFLAGECDRLVPSLKEAQFMASRMPQATAVILKGYGHICLINHDFNLLDYVLPWLEKTSLLTAGLAVKGS